MMRPSLFKSAPSNAIVHGNGRRGTLITPCSGRGTRLATLASAAPPFSRPGREAVAALDAHTFATLNLDAGASLRDLQDAMGHASPRATRRYDRSRGNLDRSPGYLLAGYLSHAR
jgi:integrase